MAPVSDELKTVHNEVKGLLAKSQAYKRLPEQEKRSFVQNLVKVSSFLADPDWLDDTKKVRAEALKESSPVAGLRDRIKKQSKGIRSNDFQAAAVEQGVEQFGNLVKTVDFPAFVSGLVQGVFQAVVDASIQQMRAYGELLSATAMTVEKFANDHVDNDQARSQLVARYPSALEIRAAEDGVSRLRIKENYDGDTDFAKDYGLPSGSIDVSDPESEQRLVDAAKREIASSRQQMMATMVLLGINRIVVTNGRINAKVVFDIQASDEAKRIAKAASSETHDVKTKASASTGFLTNLVGGFKASASTAHNTKVTSSVDDTSESKAKVKAQLSGEVRLNFKSETFPLERLADSVMISNINTIAEPNNKSKRAENNQSK